MYMETAKDRVIKFIENLPDNLSEEEIAYHLYVREEILKAQKESREGKLFSHQVVKEHYKNL